MKSQRDKIIDILKTGEATSAEILSQLQGAKHGSVLAALKVQTDKGTFLRRKRYSNGRDIWVYRLPGTEPGTDSVEDDLVLPASPPVKSAKQDNFREALGLLLSEMQKDGFESVTVKDTGEVVFRRLVIEEGTIIL